MNSIEVLAETLSLTELIRLQDVLSRTITRRFEKHLALAVSEVAGSTAYFARFGDEAGRQLLQRHLDLLQAALAPEGGRIIEGARSGVLLRFEGVAGAVRAMVALQRAVAMDNNGRRPEHHLQLRVGMHAGAVLADGAMVSGDAVNLCGGVAGAAQPGDLMLSQPVFTSLTDPDLRLRARRHAGVRIDGLEAPQDLFSLDWKDSAGFPALVRFDDGSVARLPSLDVIRFGRLREQDGMPANDVLVSPADPQLLTCISRWHFELHRRPDGYAIRPVSGTSTTEYDGQTLLRGEEQMVRTGGKVRLGGVFGLEFLADNNPDEATRRLP